MWKKRGKIIYVPKNSGETIKTQEKEDVIEIKKDPVNNEFEEDIKEYKHQKPNIQYVPKMQISQVNEFVKMFPNVSERTIDIIKSVCLETIDCIICQSIVQRKDPIWICELCSQPFHLKCIKTWILKINYPETNQLGRIIEEVEWSCPKCAHRYLKEMPKYVCYCGQKVNPKSDPFIIPHSCGKVCSKLLHPWCTHTTCNLLCHPGPCLPCMSLTDSICFCGNSTIVVKCNEKIGQYSCGKPCLKKLSCNKHFCPKKCHQGICESCLEKNSIYCYCQKEKKELNCGIDEFSCNSICGKTLECKNHKCKELCHKGPCKSCELDPKVVDTCPCGKMAISLLSDTIRTSCIDPIPTC